MASAFAPMALEILGNHTEFQEGLAIAAALQFGVRMEGEARADDQVVLHHEGASQTETFSLQSLQKNHHYPWSYCVKGVLLELLKCGIPLTGFEATVTSQLPLGFDVNTASLLAVATAVLMQKLHPYEAAPGSLAKICHDAEFQMGNAHAGYLAQLASLAGVQGCVLLLDFRTLQATAIQFPDTHKFVVCDSGGRNLLVHSKVKLRHDQFGEALRVAKTGAGEIRSLRDINPVEMQRISGDLNQYVFRTAMHVVTENQRVREAAEALTRGDVAGFGANLTLSHMSSQQSIENSTPSLDQLVEIAKGLAGFAGSRLSGHGFGGATVHLVRAEDADSFKTSLLEFYSGQTGKHAEAFIAELCNGALLI